MAKVNKTFPSPYNGMSEQISELTLDNQCVDMVNCIPDLVLGLTKRPPAHWLTRIPGLSSGTQDGIKVTQTGWYRVTINTDTFDDIDRDTLTYTGGEFLGSNPTNHTISSDLDLETTGAFYNIGHPWFKSRVVDSTHLEAERNALDDLPDGNYRCKFIWNKATRTWSRTDYVDYWLYQVNQGASFSRSVGVCTNDPRFLVELNWPISEVWNKSGVVDEYPKAGLIWLFAGETI